MSDWTTTLKMNNPEYWCVENVIAGGIIVDAPSVKVTIFWHYDAVSLLFLTAIKESCWD